MPAQQLSDLMSRLRLESARAVQGKRWVTRPAGSIGRRLSGSSIGRRSFKRRSGTSPSTCRRPRCWRSGRDVGIPDRYLRQAMLEEQTRLPDQAKTGLWDRLAGPALVGTGRVIRGDPAVASSGRFSATWSSTSCSRSSVSSPGASAGSRSAEFPPRSAGRPRRSTSGTRPFMLSKVELVTATLTPLEPGYCHVALHASVRQLRSTYLGGGAAAVTAGVGRRRSR